MKPYLTILLLVLFTKLYSQTYLGGSVNTQYASVEVTSEIDTSFIVLSLKTSLNQQDPTFKARLGFKAGPSEFHLVVFAPIFNLSLREFKYNTPFNLELRYRPKWEVIPDILLVGGTEIYQDQFLPYLSIGIPFK